MGRRAQRAALAYETSGGNALYVRELVAGALDSDALKLVGGLWRLVGRPPVSASLTDLVASRMQDLGEDERRAVELLALGEPLRLAELESLTSSRSLASLQEHGLVTVAGVTADAEVRLAHPLYGETLRSRMVSLRVRDLLLALVQTVQGRAELEPEDTVRLARWLSDAGEPIATGLLIRAPGRPITPAIRASERRSRSGRSTLVRGSRRRCCSARADCPEPVRAGRGGAGRGRGDGPKPDGRP